MTWYGWRAHPHGEEVTQRGARSSHRPQRRQEAPRDTAGRVGATPRGLEPPCPPEGQLLSLCPDFRILAPHSDHRLNPEQSSGLHSAAVCRQTRAACTLLCRTPFCHWLCVATRPTPALKHPLITETGMRRAWRVRVAWTEIRAQGLPHQEEAGALGGVAPKPPAAPDLTLRLCSAGRSVRGRLAPRLHRSPAPGLQRPVISVALTVVFKAQLRSRSRARSSPPAMVAMPSKLCPV